MTGKRKVIALALLLVAAAGCATGRPLTVQGNLGPAGSGIAPENVLPRVAILDFDYPGAADGVIGRDYDNVRPIVWKGAPGAAIADLVAASLHEKGHPVVRVAMSGHVPAGVLVTVRGRIDEFRVDARRIHSVKVESSARVAATVFAEGSAVPPDWSSGQISSDVWVAEPFFVTPDGVRDAIASAAGAVGTEAALRVSTLSGAFTPPQGASGFPGAGGASPR